MLPALSLPAFKLPRRKGETSTPGDSPSEPVARSSRRSKPTRPTVKLPAFKLPRRKGEKDGDSAEVSSPSRLSRLPLPNISGRTAAAIIGAVIGFGLVLSTVGVLRGCEALRGTKSCGGAGGFTLLMVLVVAAIYLGALLLRTFDIPDPGSTSFLAVGIVVVLSMIVFIESLLDWWMFILIPIMSAGAYVLSHYVTTALVEPAMDQHRERDVHID